MEELKLSIEEIKELIVVVKTNNVEKLKIKQGNFSIEILGNAPARLLPEISTESPSQVLVSPGENTLDTVVNQENPVKTGTVVVSPIVGTFYKRSSPDKAPYVKVGDRVAEGDVLFIIESMKLMNEVTCECAGIVTEIHAEDAQPVEYGQPILTIE